MPKKKIVIRFKRNPKKVDNSFVISQYYGFKEIDLPNVSSDDRRKAKSINKGAGYEHEDLPALDEQVAIVRQTKENKGGSSHPVMYYQNSRLKGSVNEKTHESNKTIKLHIVGSPKSIAEAILIKTVLNILEEEGHKNMSVEINSVGGKEAYQNFMRDIKAYYRKNLHKLNANCRQLFKDGPHALVSCVDEIDPEIRDNAPSPLNYLTEANRNHFKEVLEYLESQNIPYSINKDILGDPNYSSHTIFTIIEEKTGKILATGSRCNQLSKKIGYKKEIPAICASLKLSNPKKVSSNHLVNKKKIKFYFIQIGFDAKLKSLQIIDMLRKAHIPSYQSLTRDKLSTQLETARRIRSPYILLVGQKEAKENSVVVRDTNMHSQVSVPIDKLVDYLKKL